jgi:uncharacterized membrane protein
MHGGVHMKHKKKGTRSISPLGALQLMFVVLKLTDLVDWSWAMVFSPAIVHIVFFVIAFVISLVWEWMG